MCPGPVIRHFSDGSKSPKERAMSLPRPSEPLLDRFRADATALGVDGDLGVAVSGGPDSLALLLLAAAAFPGRVQAATVDHGLRPESAGEAQFVAGLCRTLDVPHAILAANVDTSRASLQRAARDARYAALEAWMASQSLRILATAHHVDDQAETLLMRLLRGSGVGGLSGVRARSPLPVRGSDTIVIRPLLGWRRAALRDLVEAAGLVAVDDPSNRDPGFDRVRIRGHLNETSWLDPEAMARSAAALAEAEDALTWTAERLWQERARIEEGEISLDPRGLPAELRRRLLLRALDALKADVGPPRGEEITRLLETLAEGGTATLAGVRCTGGELWLFGCAPPRRESK
jgi:tRNA(Ile)-lysidine synthase